MSLIKLTFLRLLYAGLLPSALSILFMLMFIILWDIYLVVVESLSSVWLFVMPWTAAHQASLSFTIFQSLLKFMPIELVMLSSHLILSSTSPPALNLSQHQGLLEWVSSSHQVAKVMELHLQRQSLQWTFRVDFL